MSTMYIQIHGGQMMASETMESEPLELESHVVVSCLMWVLGPKLSLNILNYSSLWSKICKVFFLRKISEGYAGFLQGDFYCRI